MTDEQIIELYFARDERAISETANAHGAYCFGVAMRILKSHMDSEECVNDTWLRAWNTIPPKRPSILRTYLAHIIRNVAISRYRREHAPDSPLHELTECLPNPDGTPAEAATSAELREALNSFVTGLEETDRTAENGDTMSIAWVLSTNGETQSTLPDEIQPETKRCKKVGTYILGRRS